MIPPDPQPSQVSIGEILVPGKNPLVHCRVTSGRLTREGLKTLTAALAACAPDRIVFMESADVRLPVLEPPEEQAWLLAAGEYRRVQEQFKARGGRLLSLVTECLVGGVYLVHGMAAQHRFIYDTATVYPSLPGETYEAIFKKPYPHPVSAHAALESGIVTEITTPEAFWRKLARWL